MDYAYKLTEEIARWAFEVHIKNNTDWWIAFTNPTAGPWKCIESLDDKLNRKEIYRFRKEQNRPDIIIINDQLETILILEAKDSLVKLINTKQLSKSCNVVGDIAKILSQLKNKYWLSRRHYQIYSGLLWGSNSRSLKDEIDKTFSAYAVKLEKFNPTINSFIQIGIESTKKKDESISLIYHTNSNDTKASDIIMSLK